MDQDKKQQQQDLLASLVQELRQTERSAEVHGAREARRLRDATPARALEAVVAHAARVNHMLPAFIAREGLSRGRLGRLVGDVFSIVRQAILDRVLDEERSYRATLVGLRHGVDLVRMIRHVADASGRVEIGGFCTRWLDEREPLVADAEHAMSWFAHHPAAALA